MEITEGTYRKFAESPIELLLRESKSSIKGLSNKEARKRLLIFGLNEAVREKKKNPVIKLFSYFKDPLVILLIVLGIISRLTGDSKAAVLITIMIFLSVILRFVQEYRADRSAEKLKSLVKTTATVLRNNKKTEIEVKRIVVGDIISLSAGDFVPADARLVMSRDLHMNQAMMTGESLPVEKHAEAQETKIESVFEYQNLCFMGTNVASGTATALVVATGKNTRFGNLAKNLVGRETNVTDFDRGIKDFTWLMIRFMFVMVPMVFVLNSLSRGNTFEALLFAVAIAVGLTPEMLPMIVTVNLSRAALDMSGKKVIVKRLNAIQNFGAMNILCTDKTGTLTEGQVALIKHLDLTGRDNEKVLSYSFLNSHYQTGLKNLMDEAVLKHGTAETRGLIGEYSKVDEAPFDFKRRRMSVVVEKDKRHILICKGAIEEMLSITKEVEIDGKITPFSKFDRRENEKLIEQLNSEGFRLLALGYRECDRSQKTYSAKDEKDLILLGYLAFLDPPKPTAGKAIADLKQYGTEVKILTGDNELVTRKICSEVGLEITGILKGQDVEMMTDEELGRAAEKANVFDKLEPLQKSRVVSALRKRHHVVGYLGDGINDAPALEAADVGISVDGAVDIAKESSDIILLEKNLEVLKDGLLEGRRAFGNIVKFVKMTASSNFGNMFSVLGASLFLPFLPMLPLQVVINNLLYDFSQISIPTDGVDASYLEKPRKWDLKHIKKFILWFGPISSIFDYATFFVLLYVFHAWNDQVLFHTGWFVESLLTQTLIVHIIRTQKIPFIQSRPSKSLLFTTLAVVAIGIYLPFSPLAGTLGFKPLPGPYWLIIAFFLVAYFLITQTVKKLFVKRYGWQ